MGWLRANRRRTGGLALFALALQLILAFGHTHPAPTTAATTDIVASIPSPAGDPPQHPLDDCAICAVTHLAGTLALPASASLIVPGAMHVVWDDTPRPKHVAARTAAFQARGPPLT
jgi:hypothetical protein